MTIRDQFKTMADLQDQINTQISSTWRENGNAWYRAIWIEAAEMMDHIHYKWWKSGDMDLDQVRLELVDIFHFALSDMLEKLGTSDRVADQLMQDWAEKSAATMPPLEAAETLAERTLVIKGFDPVSFFQTMAAVGMDLNDLYALYVAKNVLNRFRQDKGYKDPAIEYHKIIDGKEDNEHLMDIANDLDKDDPAFIDKLYAGLEAIYPT